jgi:hypothetical protein
MGKYADRTIQTYTANGINYAFQTRSLNWREIDARAEAIVSDPTKRVSDRMRRELSCLDDQKPARRPYRRYARSK